jgi:hypothetical protein
MNTRTTTLKLSALTSALALLAGCYVPSPKPSRVQTIKQQVTADAAESVRVTIALGVGKLKLSGGGSELLDARFDYNIPDWKPEVSYSVDAGLGTLTIEQPSRVVGATWPGNVRCDWELKLGTSLPMELDVELGVGKAELDLRSLTLSHVEVDAGVGEGTIDLSGPRPNDLEAEIEAGIGKLTLLLPTDIGTRVEVDGGIGKVDEGDLKPDGDGYVNDAWGKSKTSLRVDVEAGVGEVELKLADGSSI